MEARVAGAAEAALGPGYFVGAMGSYRRGKASSGDIDILIAPPPTSSSETRSRAAAGQE